MLPLKANAENANIPYFKSVGTTTGQLNDVIGIRIEFEGGLAGNGNGKLMDGVSIAFENISFVSNTVRSIASLGENLDVGEFCEKDHKYVDATPVAPTCTSSGYTKRVCSECGHIAVKDIVAPKADVKGTETPISDQTCLTDGIKVANYTCADCGADYNVISEIVVIKEHEIAEGVCTGCGKELPDALS